MSKSLDDKIQENHIVFIYSDMKAEATNKAILDIMSWSKASKDIEINVYLSAQSMGFVNTMAIYDVLASIENPISVFCLGKVGLYSTVLLAAATKGKRYALKHTVISLNQPYGFIDSGTNQQTEVEIEYKRIARERNVFEQIIADSLNKSIEEIHQYVDADTDFSALEAKQFGLIDEVLE